MIECYRCGTEPVELIPEHEGWVVMEGDYGLVDCCPDCHDKLQQEQENAQADRDLQAYARRLVTDETRALIRKLK